MSYFSKKRIEKDLSSLTVKLNFYNIENNVLDFDLPIIGNIYSGIYRFQVTFPEDYPFKSPSVKCMTRVFHPNIDEQGNVCLEILRLGWRPCFTIDSIIASILVIFESPEWENALNKEPADLLRYDRAEFERRVIETKKGIREIEH